MKKQRKLRVGDIVEVGDVMDGTFHSGQILRVTRAYTIAGLYGNRLDFESITPPGRVENNWHDDGVWFILKYDFNDYIRLSNL